MSVIDPVWLIPVFFLGAVCGCLVMGFGGCDKKHLLPGDREIEKLTLRYGDVLVFRVRLHLDQKTTDKLHEQLTGMFPVGVKVLFITESMDIETVLRNESGNSNDGNTQPTDF